MAGTASQCTQRFVIFHPAPFTMTLPKKKVKKGKGKNKILALMLRISQQNAVD